MIKRLISRGRSLFHLFHRNSLCKKNRTEWSQGGSGTQSGLHTSHTHTRLVGVPRAYSRAQRARGLCSRVSLHREGKTHQWAMATVCPLSNRSWRLIARKTRSIVMFPPKFQWLLKTHLPREVSPTVTSVHVCRSVKDTPPSTRLSLCSCSFDIFLMVLMITVADICFFFYVSFRSSTPTS